MSQPREFDLILQGATGFTGKLASEELLARAPEDLRWAVAGRSAEKVRALAERLGVQAVVADGLDPAAVGALAARTRVVLSCAGPFSRFGTPLVEACVREGTHYADLTGELPWIQELIAKHHATCVSGNTTLIPASGFDSVPADLGVHALGTELDQSAPINGFFMVRGGINGGTLHSGLALGEQGGLLGEPKSRDACPQVFPVPSLGRWAAPFLMAPVNESVVRRSATLLAEGDEGYGGQFRYDEHLLVRGRLRAHAMAAFLHLANRMLISPSGRRLLGWFGPKPGRGPSERSIREGFARLILVAGPLENPLAIRQWNWDGDPSNRITVRCLVQTGLALAAGEARRGGVLTPSSAFGLGLLRRLEDLGATQAVPFGVPSASRE